MLETMVKNQIIFYVMGTLLVLGLVTKTISVLAVKRMVKAAGRIHKSNHKLMKFVKAKFEHACMVSGKVQNVEAFVDKYVYEYKVCGISLNGLRTFAKKMLWFSLVLGTVAIFESYRIEGLGDMFIQYVEWSVSQAILLALVCYTSEDAMQIEAAKNYMVEYLENVCAHRYEKAGRMVSEEQVEAAIEQEPDEAEEMVQEPVSLSEVAAETAVRSQVEEEKKKSEQEMRIRAILEEFLA